METNADDAASTAPVQRGTKYTDEEWEQAVKTIEQAQQGLKEGREARRLAALQCEKAQQELAAARARRDRMIVEDRRPAAWVSSRAGVSGARCGQIRQAAGAPELPLTPLPSVGLCRPAPLTDPFQAAA